MKLSSSLHVCTCGMHMYTVKTNPFLITYFTFTSLPFYTLDLLNADNGLLIIPDIRKILAELKQRLVKAVLSRPWKLAPIYILCPFPLHFLHIDGIHVKTTKKRNCCCSDVLLTLSAPALASFLNSL